LDLSGAPPTTTTTQEITMTDQPKRYPSDSRIRQLCFTGDVILDQPAPFAFGDEVVIVLTARVTDVRTREPFVPGNPAREAHTLTVADVHIVNGDDVRTSPLTEAEILREHSRRYIEAIANGAIVAQVVPAQATR
jgi:hypothetical protein